MKTMIQRPATPQILEWLCREKGLFVTPELNDVLYCNNEGFTSLEGLGKYKSLKALFLEGNSLSDLKTLPRLDHLKNLFLKNNVIESLAGLASQAPAVCTLDVSHNKIRSLTDIGPCMYLSTLIASDNFLENSHDKPLINRYDFHQLHSLDIRRNDLRNLDQVLNELAQLKNLKCLYMEGNPMVATCPNYREKVTSVLPSLTYLDDSPVYDDSYSGSMK